MKSFKHKVMLVVCLLCVVLIGLVLLFTSFLLEPAYRAMTRRDLHSELDKIVQVIQQNGLLNEDKTDYQTVTRDTIDKLVVDGQCLEISDLESLQYIGGKEMIAGCVMHKETMEFWKDRYSADNLMVLGLRATVVEEGSIDTNLNHGFGRTTDQWVVGRTVPEAGVIVLLSASIERIEQAADVIQRQMLPCSIVLLTVALLMTWLIAGWFTAPVTALSAAARKIAQGDYTVQLPVTQKDEIGTLTEDFNTMVREVEKADALQKDIVANVSHDLRTPLTLIKGYAETIRDLNGNDAEKRNEQLNIIISETDRLSNLVGSVMILSRLNAGTEPFEPATFDITDFCEELSYRYADICRKNGYQLQLESPGERLITADPDMLSRVLHNLISNAIAHIGEDGAVRIIIRDAILNGENRPVKASEQTGADCREGIVVEVADNGEGIDAQELPHVFERYYRARQSNGKQGTGLGLSIVRAILLTHKFGFGVQSTKGLGSAFWFSAPLARPTKNEASPPENSRQHG